MSEDQQCNNNKPYTSKDKWIIAIISGLLFLLIASPFLFSAVNDIIGLCGITTAKCGCPTVGGLLLHAVIFVLAVRLLMR